jgi:hypothetical protein
VDDSSPDGYSKEWKIVNGQDILTILAIITLLVGLGSAVLIYQTAGAGSDSDNVLGYEITGGTAYPIRPEDSRSYQRNLQFVGGKAYVLIDEFQRWFTGLWHGKTLAFIVAGITILLSSGFFYAANNLPSWLEYNGKGEKNRDGPS